MRSSTTYEWGECDLLLSKVMAVKKERIVYVTVRQDIPRAVHKSLYLR
jgi:hypothetical protein